MNSGFIEFRFDKRQRLKRVRTVSEANYEGWLPEPTNRLEFCTRKHECITSGEPCNGLPRKGEIRLALGPIVSVGRIQVTRENPKQCAHCGVAYQKEHRPYCAYRWA